MRFDPIKYALAPFALMISSSFAQAANQNFVDGYLVFGEVEVGSNSEDGDGLGVKAAGQVHERIFLTGEFQNVDIDNSRGEIEQLRFGAGFGPGMGARNEGPYGRVEYVTFDNDFGPDNDGLGGTVGYAIPIDSRFRLHGEFGYLLLDDLDGPELTLGGSYEVIPNFGIFADYRRSFLELDNGADVDLSDFRLGGRFYF